MEGNCNRLGVCCVSNLLNDRQLGFNLNSVNAQMSAYNLHLNESIMRALNMKITSANLLSAVQQVQPIKAIKCLGWWYSKWNSRESIWDYSLHSIRRQIFQLKYCAAEWMSRTLSHNFLQMLLLLLLLIAFIIVKWVAAECLEKLQKFRNDIISFFSW